MFNLVQRPGKGVFGYLGVVAEGHQDLALAFELLHQIDLEISTSGHFQCLEDGLQRDVVVLRGITIGKVRNLVEQVLETQQGADALVERIFVANHRTFSASTAPLSSVAMIAQRFRPTP